MKKYFIFTFYLAIITLFSCNGGKKDNSTATDETADVENIVTTVLEINDTTRLSEHEPSSPTLIINISLPIIEGKNQTATDNINQTVAYSLFESNKNSLTAACNDYIALQKEYYCSQLPQYINLGETDTQAAFFNNYSFINGEARTGYNGCINYIVYSEEYSGGAHPNSYHTVLNFDPESGEEILLESIFKPDYEEELIQIIKNILETDSNITKDFNEERIGELYISNNYILEKEQITFIYNKYDISYYAAGDIFVKISYDKLKQILK